MLEAVEVPEGFHATHHAVRKRYRYVIYDGPIRDVFQRHFVWHYSYGRLDAAAMHRAAAALVGAHDFRSFQSSGAEPQEQRADRFRVVRRTRLGSKFPLAVWERGRG